MQELRMFFEHNKSGNFYEQIGWDIVIRENGKVLQRSVASL